MHDEYLVPLLERAAAALGDRDSPLRVRLLSRLAGGPLRSPQFPPERRFELSQEAIQMARRLGDPATLAYALDARIPAIESPERTQETLELSTELLDVATTAGDKERVLEAHEHRHERFVELGEMDEAEAELEAMRRLAEELRQPAQRWLVSVCRARLALQEGRFSDAEALIEQARDLGEHALSWNAAVAFRAQLYMLYREQGRLEEARELVARAGVEYPGHELWPCAMAQIEAALGNRAERSGLWPEMTSRACPSTTTRGSSGWACSPRPQPHSTMRVRDRSSTGSCSLTPTGLPSSIRSSAPARSRAIWESSPRPRPGGTKRSDTSKPR
jgi:tetratricopeptide (TPR) repeat protein